MEKQLVRFRNANSGNEFVGFYINKNGTLDDDVLNVVFPIGFRLNSLGLQEINKDNLNDIETLVRLLSSYQIKNQSPLDNGPVSNSGFPFFDYMNVIEYFIQHDFTYYKESEYAYDIGGSGKISWRKTIEKVTPNALSGKIMYLNTVVRHNSVKDDGLITLINKYCVYKACEFIGVFYGGISVEKPVDFKEDNIDYYINFLYKKIAQTNNDTYKQLFNSMVSILKNDNHITDENKFLFGTYEFHYIWEEVVDSVLGSGTEINKKIFNPFFSWQLYDEFNTKCGSPFIPSYMRPDTIYFDGSMNKIYIIDAKYYKEGNLPGSADINKQFSYIEYARNKFKGQYSVNHVSPFILPFNSSNCSKKFYVKGIAKSNELLNIDDEVYAIFVDTKDLINSYLGDPSIRRNDIINLIRTD